MPGNPLYCPTPDECSRGCKESRCKCSMDGEVCDYTECPQKRYTPTPEHCPLDWCPHDPKTRPIYIDREALQAIADGPLLHPSHITRWKSIYIGGGHYIPGAPGFVHTAGAEPKLPARMKKARRRK